MHDVSKAEIRASVADSLTSISATSTPLKQRATYIGFISATEYFAIAIAPIIGGALTSALSWRWCFYINLIPAPLTVAMILLSRLPGMPSTASKSQCQRLRELDLFGCCLFAPAVLCLLIALQWGGSTYSWDNVRIIVLLALSPVLFSIFCLVQHRKQNAAMLPPRIVKKRPIIAGSIFSLSLAACRAIVQYYVSLKRPLPLSYREQ